MEDTHNEKLKRGEARLSGNERVSQDFYFDLGKGSVKISIAVDLVNETTKGD